MFIIVNTKRFHPEFVCIFTIYPHRGFQVPTYMVHWLPQTEILTRILCNHHTVALHSTQTTPQEELKFFQQLNTIGNFKIHHHWEIVLLNLQTTERNAQFSCQVHYSHPGILFLMLCYPENLICRHMFGKNINTQHSRNRCCLYSMMQKHILLSHYTDTYEALPDSKILYFLASCHITLHKELTPYKYILYGIVHIQ
jgi:hypothetical protein